MTKAGIWERSVYNKGDAATRAGWRFIRPGVRQPVWVDDWSRGGSGETHWGEFSAMSGGQEKPSSWMPTRDEKDERPSACQAGIPGLRGTDHIGFTVPNLDEAVTFFVDVIGCEPFYQLGPFQADDDWMTTHLNVHPRAVMRKLQFLRCRNGSNFEVFEYESPDQRAQQPKNSDVGGHHLALYVDDMQAAVDHLKSHGVRMLGEPTLRTAGPNAGQTWVYFLTPWGMQMELVSFPGGKGYEKTTDRRLWHPADPEK